VSFAAITLCVASQRLFIVVRVYFVIDSLRKLLDTPSYLSAVVTEISLVYLCTVSSTLINILLSFISLINKETLFLYLVS
jgi:hypothetical protein